MTRAGPGEVNRNLIHCRYSEVSSLAWVYCFARSSVPVYTRIAGTLTLTLTLTLSLFNQPKNHLPPCLVADEKRYILTITHTTYSG
jgi:hypothetical protein